MHFNWLTQHVNTLFIYLPVQLDELILSDVCNNFFVNILQAHTEMEKHM